MNRRLRQFACLALMAAVAVPALAQTHKPRARRKAHPAKMTQPQPTQAPAPAPPAPPPTPEQLPPTPPQVSYNNNQLTIVANNSTLADVLNAVRARTGAKIDMPGTTAGERVAAHLGPGQARDVLARLLAGSPFDFVLLGSASDPNAITDIVLTPHAGGTAVASAGGSAPPASTMPQPAMVRPVPSMPPDEDTDEQPEPEPQAPPQPPVAEPIQQPRPPQGAPGMQQPPQGAPGMQQPPGAQIPPSGTTEQGQQNQVKTPEQLLQELQRMQQQEQQRRQQQQQQQQPQPPPN